jgi:hypothetical protein
MEFLNLITKAIIYKYIICSRYKVTVDSFPNLAFKFIETEKTPFSLLRHAGKPVGQLKPELLLENGRKPLWEKTMLEETKSVVKTKEKSVIRKNRN